MKISKFAKYLILIILSLIFLFPLVSVLMVATRSYSEILYGWWNFGNVSFSFRGFIKSWSHENWPLWQGIINSLKYVLPACLVSVFISFAAAYFLSRHKVFGKKMFLTILLVFYAISVQSFIVILYKIMNFLNLIDNLLSLFIMHVSLSLLWMIPFFYNYFKFLPREIEEAAKIEGASELTIITSIAIPIALPAMVSMAILQFTMAWGDFFMPLVLIQSLEKYPCVLQLPKFVGYMSADFQSMASAAIWSMLPPLCVYILFKKYLIKGVTGLTGE